jgi:predicted nucleic acid-binding protein
MAEGTEPPFSTDEGATVLDGHWRRALDVQGALWRAGQTRAVGFPDLLIAAVAERERVTVLHYDGDYDLIAKITGQPVRWIVSPGAVP